MADTVQNSITVGLIGNPNCGKTTLFNAFTGAKLKTANWPGVTVERTEGEIIWNGQNVHLIDLPGIYSLDSYTIEEKVAEKFLEEGEADVIINIADASLLERSLYLTMQLLELKKPVVLALNMMDGAESKRTELDVKALSEGLGQIPVVPLSAKSRIGLDILMDTVEKVSQERKTGGVLHSVVLKSDRSQSKAEFIERLVGQCVKTGADGFQEGAAFTDWIDGYLTHPVLGIPLFLGIMAAVFWLTFTVGDYLKGYFLAGLDEFSGLIRELLEAVHTADWAVSLVVDGIAAGVGGVLSFLPNIAILFLAMAFLEDSGYMARIAYVMDDIMGKAGLSGKAFLPMLLGFGCSVPAVMASRTLSTMEDRKKTIAMIPFMSCSAKLPVYVLFAEMFFPQHAMAAACLLYGMGLAAAVLTAMLIHKGEDGEENALLIELPQYRMPGLRNAAIYVWEKVKDYLSKAGTTIFLASIVLWLILNVGTEGFVTEVSDSIAAQAGQMLVPVLRPCGLGSWQIAVALLSGLSAKEVVVASFSVLYNIRNINSPAGMMKLSMILRETGFGPLNACAMLVFCLLYTPCIAALSVIRRETGSVKWTLGLAAFQFITAWTAAAFIYQIGRLIL